MAKLVDKPNQLFALLCVDNGRYMILKAKMFHAITKTHLLDYLMTQVCDENRHYVDLLINSYWSEYYRNDVSNHKKILIC